MEEVKNQNEGKKQLSYEELNKVACEMSMQLQKVTQQLEAERQKYKKDLTECNMFNMFKRLEFLFKVVENAPMFDAKFVEEVVNEIQALITIPKKEEESGNGENGHQ